MPFGEVLFSSQHRSWSRVVRVKISFYSTGAAQTGRCRTAPVFLTSYVLSDGEVEELAITRSSSRSSSHIAFMTAKMAARGRPKSQAKYHICLVLYCVGSRSAGAVLSCAALTGGYFLRRFWSIKSVRIFFDIGLGHFAPEHFVNPCGVHQNQWHKDRGDHQHDEQGQMRRRTVPNG